MERLRGLLGAANADVLALEGALVTLSEIEIPAPTDETGVGKFSREIKDLLNDNGVAGSSLLHQGIMTGVQGCAPRHDR